MSSSATNHQNNKVPDHVAVMRRVPPPFMPPRAAYGIDGLTRATIAWMLDINVRASIKKREFQRTWIRTCMYIKHCERIMDINGITYVPYTNEVGGDLTSKSRENFKPHMASTMVTRGPIVITGPVKNEAELIKSVSDTQTMEFKLHQLEVLRFMGRADPQSLKEFNESRRVQK